MTPSGRQNLAMGAIRRRASRDRERGLPLARRRSLMRATFNDYYFCDIFEELCIIDMVKLIETSSLSAEVSPILREWDELVRKNFNKYQSLIDARTYELQRVQRYILVRWR